MADLELEKQKALAIAKARRRKFEANKLESEIQGRQSSVVPVDGPKGDEAVSLPLPNTRMYDDLPMEDAQSMYDAYKRHPHSQTGVDGQLIYKNTVVNFPEGALSRVAQSALNPVPSPNDFEEAGVGAGQRALGTARNLVKDTAKTYLGEQKVIGNAMAPEADDSTFTTASKALLQAARGVLNPIGSLVSMGQQAGVIPTAEDVDKNIASYNPAGVLDPLESEGTKMVAGGLAGASLANTATQGVKNIPQFLKTAAKFAAGEVGANTALSDRTGTLVTGNQKDEALYQLWSGFGKNKDGNYDDNLVRRKLNIMAEGIALAGAAEKGLKGVTFLAKFFNDITGAPLARFLGKGSQEEYVVRDMIAATEHITDSTTSKEAYEITMRVAEDAKKYAELTMKNPLSGEDITVPRDTMGALEKGVKAGDDPDKIARLRAQRAAIRGRNATQTETVLGRPAEAVKNFSDQAQGIATKESSVDETLGHIQTAGENEVNKFKAEVPVAEKKVSSAENDVASLVEDDPTLGEVFKKAKNSDIDITVRNENLDRKNTVLDNQNVAEQTRKKEVDDAYAAIPENTPADMNSLKSIYSEVRDDLPPEIQTRVESLIAKSDGTFKYVNNELRPRITAMVDEAFDGKKDYAKPLARLRKNINEDQIAYLTENGNEVSIKAAKDAQKKYAAYDTEFGQGINSELRQNARQTGINKPYGGRKIDFNEKGRSTLDAIYKPNRRESTQQLISTLASPEGKRSEHLIADIAISDSLSDVARDITNNGKKLTDIDVDRIAKPLEDVAASFSGVQQERINSFLTKLRNKKSDVAALQEEVKRVQAAAKSAEDRIYGKELGKFYESGDEKVTRKTNGSAIFKSIMNEDEAVPKIKNLMKRAREGDPTNPLAEHGLRAAYQEELKSKVLMTGESPSGAPKMNVGAYQDLDKEGNKLLAIGDELYKNEPEVMEVTRALLKEAGDLATSQSQRTGSVTDTESVDKATREATNLIITLWRGSLDRLGARIRATTGRAITTMSKKQQVSAIMDEMYADPKKFSEIARSIASKDVQKIPQHAKDALWKFGTRAGLYTPEYKDQYGKEFDKVFKVQKVKGQTEEAFPKVTKK